MLDSQWLGNCIPLFSSITGLMYNTLSLRVALLQFVQLFNPPILLEWCITFRNSTKSLVKMNTFSDIWFKTWWFPHNCGWHTWCDTSRAWPPVPSVTGTSPGGISPLPLSYLYFRVHLRVIYAFSILLYWRCMDVTGTLILATCSTDVVSVRATAVRAARWQDGTQQERLKVVVVGLSENPRPVDPHVRERLVLLIL